MDFSIDAIVIKPSAGVFWRTIMLPVRHHVTLASIPANAMLTSLVCQANLYLLWLKGLV